MERRRGMVHVSVVRCTWLNPTDMSHSFAKWQAEQPKASGTSQSCVRINAPGDVDLLYVSKNSQSNMLHSPLYRDMSVSFYAGADSIWVHSFKFALA